MAQNDYPNDFAWVKSIDNVNEMDDAIIDLTIQLAQCERALATPRPNSSADWQARTTQAKRLKAAARQLAYQRRAMLANERIHRLQYIADRFEKLFPDRFKLACEDFEDSLIVFGRNFDKP